MKKITLLLLLLVSTISFGQTILPNKIRVLGATKNNDATRKVVQDSITKEYHWKLDKNGTVTSITGTDGVTVANGTTAPVIGISSISQLKVAGLVTDLAGKVDKVTGKSLLSDAEITRLTTLANYTHPANHPPSIITQDASNRFVTDAEKATWNGKQSALGYTAENSANKNLANGYAGLGSNGKLISSQLPDITISDTFITSSQAAMLAVIAETGDVAVRTDLNKTFILKGTNPAVLSDWQELLTPTSAVTTVFGRNGAVTAQTGDYNADQITETTRKFQTANQNTFNDVTSSTQTQLNGKLSSSGTAANATLWRGLAYNNATPTSSPLYFMGSADGGTYGYTSIAEAKTTLGFNPDVLAVDNTIVRRSNDGTSMVYAGYFNMTKAFLDATLISDFVTTDGNGVLRKNSASAVKTFLGLGSNAYTSTAYLPLTGGTLSGSLQVNNGHIQILNAGIATSLISPTSSINGGSSLDLNAYVYGNNPYGIWTNGVKRVTVGGDGNTVFSGSIISNILNSGLIGAVGAGTAYRLYSQGGVSYGIGTSTNGGIEYMANQAAAADSHKFYGGVDNASPKLLLTIAGTGNLSALGSVTATAFYQSSDRRLKKILKRDGEVAYFKWKDNRDTKTHIGYIAQEVKKEFPDQVQKDEKGMLSVNYIEVLVAKIQDLEKRIKQLEKR
ncbi:tail fiber domain-containing protein [Flavobacterium sp. GT3P67]|uniref:tail fiber domain-containing protein n=1 Tax=Flavobacterium sp. GT3P67 TaxID=2541722 RepID=UPI00197ABD84|nr:tail fiber domain-containing protein [Flavobacterium sp. GT3P67]